MMNGIEKISETILADMAGLMKKASLPIAVASPAPPIASDRALIGRNDACG